MGPAIAGVIIARIGVRWGGPGLLRETMPEPASVQQLMNEGRVRNLEVDFRLGGVVAPYLMSAVVVTKSMAAWRALNVARNADRCHQEEEGSGRTLREAQQLRRARGCEELTATQARLLRAEWPRTRGCGARRARQRSHTAQGFRSQPRHNHRLEPVRFSAYPGQQHIFRETGRYSRRKFSASRIYLRFWASLARREQVNSGWIATASHTIWRPTS